MVQFRNLILIPIRVKKQKLDEFAHYMYTIFFIAGIPQNNSIIERHLNSYWKGRNYVTLKAWVPYTSEVASRAAYTQEINSYKIDSTYHNINFSQDRRIQAMDKR